MSASTSTSLGGVLVVTQVYPAPQGAAPPGAALPNGPDTQITKQSRALALGTVQIMIGLLVFLFGIVMATSANTIGVFSGIFSWGPMFYIVAGSVTVCASRSRNSCQVSCSLAFSIIAALASGVAVIIYMLDAIGIGFTNFCYGYPYEYQCYIYLGQTQGISAIFAIFSLLEFAVSITVAAYVCKDRSNSNSEQVFIVSNNLPPGSTAPIQTLPAFPATHQVVVFPKEPEEQGSAQLGEPPAYTPATS